MYWVLGGVLVAAAIQLAMKTLERTRRRNWIEARQPITEPEILKRFSRTADLDKASVLSAWRKVAAAFRVDAAKLRADDRLGDLRGLPIWIDKSTPYWTDVDDLYDDLTEESGLSSRELAAARTVYDLVYLLAKKK